MVKARLYVDGALVQEIKRVKSGNYYTSMNASLLYPIDITGSKTDSFEGVVYEVNVVKGEKALF